DAAADAGDGGGRPADGRQLLRPARRRGVQEAHDEESEGVSAADCRREGSRVTFLFRVADVFHLPTRVVVAIDCPQRLAPPLRIGDRIRFRTPNGTLHHSTVAGFEIFDPPNPDRPFAFSLPQGTPPGSVQADAEVLVVGRARTG